MTLRAGDRAKMVELSITDSALDMTTVTAADLVTCSPSGVKATWSWAITGATTSTIDLEHMLDPSGSDVQYPGDYCVSGWLRAPGGDLYIEPQTITVADAPCC